MRLSGSASSRRDLLKGLAAAPALTVAASKSAQSNETFESAFNAESERVQTALKGAKGTKLVLLGTGAGPVPGQTRHMASHLIVHGGAAYILDCGLGVTDQL